VSSSATSGTRSTSTSSNTKPVITLTSSGDGNDPTRVAEWGRAEWGQQGDQGVGPRG
jgi:hypothetical protein